MNTTQTIMLTGIFGVLGAATTHLWLEHTGRMARYSRKRVWMVNVSVALAYAVLWLLLDTGLDRLPPQWARLVPRAMVAGCVLLALWRPRMVSIAERDSIHRIQAGILVGGLAFAAICLWVFR